MPKKNEFQCLMSMPNLGDYLGKWIAIIGDAVVAVGDDGKAVFREAKTKFPNKEPLILKVPSDRVMLLWPPLPRTVLNCKYLSYTLPNTNPPVSIRLPLLHIRLASKESGLRTIGLVDSGSTTTFVPLEIAEMLSAPIEKEDSAIGAGGRFQNTIRRLDITVLKGVDAVAKFANFPVYVPTEADRIPYVVLGRDSIFRKFDVIFRERMQRVLLKLPKVKKWIGRLMRERIDDISD